MAVKIGGRYRTTEKWILALMQPAASVPVQLAETTHGGNVDPEEAFRILQARFGITKTKMLGSELRTRAKKSRSVPQLHGSLLPQDSRKEGHG